MRFYASDMILNIHSDASYPSIKSALSRVTGHFFLGSILKKNEPIFLNGAFHALYSILPFVTASAAE